MTVQDQQQKLISRYEILPNPQERLNALVDKSGKLPPLSDSERVEENRVHGCQSKVYIVGRLEEGHGHFRCDADSVLVKGLVALICEVYEGGIPQEIFQVEPEILQKLGVWQILSPTRQNGLTHARRVIKEWAGKNLCPGN